MSTVRPLSPEALKWSCDSSSLETKQSNDSPFCEIIGQERAVEAIRMGLER